MRDDYPDIIGKTVHGRIDRPIGTRHPQFPDTIYPLNYGYADDFLAEDGDHQDVYLLGINRPVQGFEGRVIAVYRRFNDDEDKWIISADGREYSDQNILEQIRFLEQYFQGTLLR